MTDAAPDAETSADTASETLALAKPKKQSVSLILKTVPQAKLCRPTVPNTDLAMVDKTLWRYLSEGTLLEQYSRLSASERKSTPLSKFFWESYAPKKPIQSIDTESPHFADLRQSPVELIPALHYHYGLHTNESKKRAPTSSPILLGLQKCHSGDYALLIFACCFPQSFPCDAVQISCPEKGWGWPYSLIAGTPLLSSQNLQLHTMGAEMLSLIYRVQNELKCVTGVANLLDKETMRGMNTFKSVKIIHIPRGSPPEWNELKHGMKSLCGDYKQVGNDVRVREQHATNWAAECEGLMPDMNTSPERNKLMDIIHGDNKIQALKTIAHRQTFLNLVNSLVRAVSNNHAQKKTPIKHVLQRIHEVMAANEVPLPVIDPDDEIAQCAVANGLTKEAYEQFLHREQLIEQGDIPDENSAIGKKKEKAHKQPPKKHHTDADLDAEMDLSIGKKKERKEKKEKKPPTKSRLVDDPDAEEVDFVNDSVRYAKTTCEERMRLNGETVSVGKGKAKEGGTVIDPDVEMKEAALSEETAQARVDKRNANQDKLRHQELRQELAEKRRVAAALKAKKRGHKRITESDSGDDEDHDDDEEEEEDNSLEILGSETDDDDESNDESDESDD